MKDISVPFSLFDFFAVLLPGAAGLVGVYLFLNPALTQAGHDAVFSQAVFRRLSGDLALVTSLVLSSYLMGLVLNALSELLIDKPANQFLGAHISRDLHHYNVRKAVQAKFGEDILKQSARRTFLMVQATVEKHLPEAAANASKYVALAVMFESLTLALCIIGAGIVRGWAIGKISADSFFSAAMGAILFLALIALTLWSYRRYKRMWSQTVFMSFVAWVNLEKPDGS